MKGEDQPIKTESLPIDWKEGKNVTKKTVKKVNCHIFILKKKKYFLAYIEEYLSTIF